MVEKKLFIPDWVLRSLEESLWKDETRFDREYMESILAHDFIEFGRSGRIYSRGQCVDITPAKIQAKLPLEQFRVHDVAKDVKLITYISEVGSDDIRRANRSSLWIRQGRKWLLRFHQGTPI